MKKGRPASHLPNFTASELPILKARFVRRPNRFLVVCDLDGKSVEAYLPNPGRLWELLLPGRILYLVKNPPDPSRSTAFTALAVEQGGSPILLHTHLVNDVVAHLLAAKKLPGFEAASVIRREARAGASRYDFLLKKDGREMFLEVKSCTLFGEHIAMFPDAVTERGRKHLEHLARQARQGIPGGVVFLVHSPRIDRFMPDYHTDYAFARTLLEVKDELLVKAVAVDWQGDLSLGPRVRDVEIPWNLIAREAQDRGSYLLVLEVARSLSLDVGGPRQSHVPERALRLHRLGPGKPHEARGAPPEAAQAVPLAHRSSAGPGRLVHGTARPRKRRPGARPGVGPGTGCRLEHPPIRLLRLRMPDASFRL